MKCNVIIKAQQNIIVDLNLKGIAGQGKRLTILKTKL